MDIFNIGQKIGRLSDILLTLALATVLSFLYYVPISNETCLILTVGSEEEPVIVEVSERDKLLEKVLSLHAEGQNYQQISVKLGVAQKTVKKWCVKSRLGPVVLPGQLGELCYGWCLVYTVGFRA